MKIDFFELEGVSRMSFSVVVYAWLGGELFWLNDFLYFFLVVVGTFVPARAAIVLVPSQRSDLTVQFLHPVLQTDYFTLPTKIHLPLLLHHPSPLSNSFAFYTASPLLSLSPPLLRPFHHLRPVNLFYIKLQLGLVL